MPRMKIVFLIERMNAAGMARDLADLCARLDCHRFEPSVISLFGRGVLDAELRNSGIALRYAELDPWPLSPRNLRALWRIGTELRRENVQVVHGSNYWSSVYAVIVARIAGARAITNRIDLGFAVSGAVMRWIQNFSNAAADAIVANCQAVKEAVLEREFWVAGKLFLIYNGCDCARAASGSGSGDRTLLGLPAHGPIILSVANLHPHKRHEWLLDASPAILARFPDAKIVIAGKDMGQESFLRRRAAELHIENAVLFTGVRADVPALLALAAIGTLTSETEACSNTLLEYLAAGLPVVATNVGGTPEIVSHGVTGYLVEPGDTTGLAAGICDLLEHREMALEMGARGRDRIRASFSMDRVVSEYEQLFEALAANTGAGALRLEHE
jgi:glycosyltransferase involved in cell wall biosynthesis